MAAHSADPHARFVLAAAGILWAVANVLLAVGVGHMLTISGLVCAAVGAVAAVLALAGKVGPGGVLGDAALVGTLINFNIWAFSHLANLMTFLGLFFFALFGLILGGAMFRLLRRFRPMVRTYLHGIGGGVVLACWLGGIVLEASYLPGDVMDYARKRARLSATVTTHDLDVAIPKQVDEAMTETFGTSRTLAYVVWNLDRGQMDLRIPGRGDVPMSYDRPQRRLGFAVRLSLSLLLLGYGVFSQIRWLDRTPQQERDFKIARHRARSGEETAEAADHSHSMVAGGLEEMS